MCMFVQHALFQMTLNISFLFWLSKQASCGNGGENCVSLGEHDCEVYICVVIRKKPGESGRINGEKAGEKRSMNARRKMHGKITDSKKYFYATNTYIRD